MHFLGKRQELNRNILDRIGGKEMSGVLVYISRVETFRRVDVSNALHPCGETLHISIVAVQAYIPNFMLHFDNLIERVRVISYSQPSRSCAKSLGKY